MTVRPPQTKPSTPKLSEVAKFVHVPPSGVSTGWPQVRDKLAELGIRFRWWQVAIARIVLSKNAAGKYTTTIGGVGLSIPRQVGKTFLVGALVFALCLLRPGITAIWSAHRTRTAEETFKKMQGFARRKAIKPFISKVVLGSGEESIEFINGSRIMFGARADGFGRGFDEVDIVIYDEAQILPQSALDDMIPATNQCRQPEGALMFFMGTPPQEKEINAGKAEVFKLMRDSAKQKDEDTAWIEFGADDDYVPTPLPAPLTERDWEQIAKANPSYPDDTPVESILRMRKKLGDASFLLEGAGVWPEIVKQFSPINGALWAENADVGPAPRVRPTGIGVDMSHARAISVGGCWLETESAHVEELWAGFDERACIEWIVQAAGRRTPVMIDSLSPANSMIPVLKARGVKVLPGSANDMSKGCGLVASETEASTLTHADQKSVNDAREGARKRAIGKAGGWGYDRSDPSVEIQPLVAVTLARVAASIKGPKKTDPMAGKVVASW
ncbi:terminase large subunit domain-containing protein [Pimelobacter simplex]|uniref:terminase large subunit domain-containing protein n=1 Tax=Nocardioides simplex TaxID=2045 RepID=UPI00380C2FB5